MCTAVSMKGKAHYFGRNLDYEFSYNESVTVTPRNYPLCFRAAGRKKSHYAMIGMAYVVDGYPLYYDAVNEKGLGAAGLNFPHSAVYHPEIKGKSNVASFEFIPFILSGCATVAEAKRVLADVNVCDEAFSAALPPSPLHWLIADGTSSIAVESVAEGLKVYDDPVGVLTNEPPYPWHETNLANYMGVTREEAVSRFAGGIELKAFSRGMGGVGLPGDLGSAARFVRAAFTSLNSECGESEAESVAHFFHILGAVAQQKGCCRVPKGFEYTIYSSCCNAESGVYYYTTYDDGAIRGVDMRAENLDGTALVSRPLVVAPPEIVNRK